MQKFLLFAEFAITVPELAILREGTRLAGQWRQTPSPDLSLWPDSNKVFDNELQFRASRDCGRGQFRRECLFPAFYGCFIHKLDSCIARVHSERLPKTVNFDPYLPLLTFLGADTHGRIC
jgi:hypothetical protein